MRAIASCLLVFGCVASHSVVCDNGRVCPDTYRCAPDGACYPPNVIDACAGKVDGDPCDAGGPGKCAAGVCVVAICGNGVKEFGEVVRRRILRRPRDARDVPRRLPVGVIGTVVRELLVPTTEELGFRDQPTRVRLVGNREHPILIAIARR